MAGFLFKGGLVAVVLAVIFQVTLKEAIWLAFGIGRMMQPISDFPYTCRKIVDPRMEACEDMWLSESTRQLFLACSDPLTRDLWMPNVAHLNVSARSQKDSIVALDIDKPNKNSYEFRTLQTPEFPGTAGDGKLQLVGFTGIDNPDSGSIELLVINNRPSVDAQGKLVDQYADGANATIDLFETGAEATELKFVRTYADGKIATPNRVAALSRSAFYVVNDHGQNKLGLKHSLSPFLRNGDAIFCDAETGCKTVLQGFKYPNGLTRDKNNLIYIPCSLSGTIFIYRVLPDNTLEKVDEVKTGYSIDNLSVDANGDIWVAAFPIGVAIFKAYEDPYHSFPPAAALRVRKVEGKYAVDKVIEDGEGEVLPAATTVVHDAKTGRLFFSSVISPFISVCEPKAQS
ncbi:hypothetical protein CDV31_002002 [Fusarium ambrosium]|uniref:SMP-30/Gluconolactonase/LRE-like region domain-containing protein n=1 Tax=Fusarium ambrosium TaxID=131363 RepID=A0A428UXP4_9HYPO|nr:hypothetical protein CDV31_002002 [Fusarium ambrosium]